MESRWENFLKDAGAVIEGGRVAHFGAPDQERRVAVSGSVIADLSHRGLMIAEGPDAAAFLQGQLTNDIRQVDAGHAQLSGSCSPKGRLLALFRVFPRAQAYCLSLPAELLAETLSRLRKYVLMSKVTLRDAGPELVGIGLAGPRATDELQHLLGAVPREPFEVLQLGELTVVRIPGTHPRFELYGPVAAMEKTWSGLDVHAAPVGADVWTLLDVLAGIPEVYTETRDEFIPQTVNLELLGGVSFSKGCYTGQEIVARLHYRGTVKRRMYLGTSDTDVPPRPGTPVYVPGEEQAAGTVAQAVPAPERGCAVLAVLSTAQAGDELHLGDRAGPRLTLGQQPVEISAED